MLVAFMPVALAGRPCPFGPPVPHQLGGKLLAEWPRASRGCLLGGGHPAPGLGAALGDGAAAAGPVRAGSRPPRAAGQTLRESEGGGRCLPNLTPTAFL